MYNTSQMMIADPGSGRDTGSGRDRVTGMNGWIDMQLAQVRARSESLAGEARSERLARMAASRGPASPSVRARLLAAVAAWRQPGRVTAA
jgi:hypothetical protein